MNSNNNNGFNSKNNSLKCIIEGKNQRKNSSQIEKIKIYEYEGFYTHNNRIQKKEKNIIDITKNYRRRIPKNIITNKSNNDIKSINSVKYFSEKEDIINLKKKYSLNKGPNTKSTTVINYKIKTLDLKDNYRKDNIYNKNTSKINNRYELNYESDIGEKNNKLYEQNKTESNIGNYKYNTIFYSNINHTNNNLKKMNSINNLEKKENRYEIKTHNCIKFKNKINNNEFSLNNNINDNIRISTINVSKRIPKNEIKIKNICNPLIIKINKEKKAIKFKNYHRPSEIKKIILIQSKFRTYLSKQKFIQNCNIYKYYKEFLESLGNIILARKKKLWKYFVVKIKINKKKAKRDNNKNKIMNTDLMIKLNEIRKKNKDLKNKIYDNKNIEEKINQLLEENKKTQDINEKIMEDNIQLSKKLKNLQENKNNQLVISNQLSVGLNQDDDVQSKSNSKLKYLYLKCIFYKKELNDRNSLKIFFNKYRNNVKKLKKKYSIENNNIFINNKKKINIQMAKNLNINFISQNDNYKYFILFKLFMKKEQRNSNLIPKYFYKFYYSTNDMNKDNKEECDLDKKRILKNLLKKKENNNQIILKNKLKEWKLRGVIFKMKGAAKELKRKKKLKKKIRDKIAKETLNNLKNKTANFQSAHEFSYNVNKNEEDKELNKTEENI